MYESVGRRLCIGDIHNANGATLTNEPNPFAVPSRSSDSIKGADDAER